MSEKAQRAKALFLEGYNCAQAVAGAFAPEMGLSVDAAARLASGFGGGMGRMREVCGAVSGMTLAASALRGYNDPKAGLEKTPEYYKKRPCPELVALAAQILEEWLAEHPARL